jgi:hypothetical protein
MTPLSGGTTLLVKDFDSCLSISRRHTLNRGGTAAPSLLRRRR